MSEHTVTVLMDGREEKRLYAPAGALFLQLLKGNGHSLVCCNGKGGCGRCRIRFPDGDAPLPMPADRTRSPRRNFGTASVWPVYTG